MSSLLDFAKQLTQHYFNLNQTSFNESLADKVVFSVNSTLVNLDGKEDNLDITIEGKKAVANMVALRHFNITKVAKLEEQGYTLLNENQVKVNFISEETKQTESDFDPVTFEYRGHYTLTVKKVDETYKATEIALVNRRKFVISMFCGF